MIAVLNGATERALWEHGAVRLGLHALGIGPGARRDVIDAVAAAAERSGFATLWAGEHVIMVDRSQSRYPYAADGQIAVPPVADWLDPLVGLSFNREKFLAYDAFLCGWSLAHPRY